MKILIFGAQNFFESKNFQNLSKIIFKVVKNRFSKKILVKILKEFCTFPTGSQDVYFFELIFYQNPSWKWVLKNDTFFYPIFEKNFPLIYWYMKNFFTRIPFCSPGFLSVHQNPLLEIIFRIYFLKKTGEN